MSVKLSKGETIKLFRTTRYSRSFNDATIFNFLSSLNCPRALTVWMLYRENEHLQLADLTIDSSTFNNAGDFADAYAATCFLSKSDFLDLPISKKDAAMTKFREYEELCQRTNERFQDLSVDPLYQGVNVTLLHATQRKIASILGSFSAEEFVDDAGWGPGVSTLLKGSEVSAFNKFRDERGITRNLYSLVKPWFTTAYPTWVRDATGEIDTPLDTFFTLVDGNQVVTVPKNSKTDRVIAIEPGFNIWFQKAIGSMLRKRLRRVGIDLNTQERNQLLATRSSQDGELATVDFSSASDSISRGVVEALVEDSRWLSLMETCRSQYGTLDGKRYKWKKFSAMGNGFTFELESLIFFAVASAVCEHLGLDARKISVFGDDVILPVEAFSLYSSFSAFLGFRVNTKKSFASGVFRESCGAHAYDGVDVKPIYLKGKVTNVESVFKLANAVRTYAHRRNFSYGCDSRFVQCWRHLLRGIPKPLRFGIPQGFGDGGLLMNLDEAMPSISRPGHPELPKTAGRGFEGFLFPMFAFTGVCRTSDHSALLLARMKVPSTELSYNNEYTLRGVVRVRIIPNVLVSQWYNLGPWTKNPKSFVG